MKEHPMLMKGPLIIATLNDAKTQTRRLPTSSTALVDGKHVSAKAWKALDLDWEHSQVDGRLIRLPERNRSTGHILTPKWEVGDHLWLRETWSPMWRELCDNCAENDPRVLDENGHCEHFYVEYKADTGHSRPGDWPDPEPNGDFADAPAWKPSIHMFRWASRIDLEALEVRAERIQDISERDAWAEGIGALDDVHQDAARRVAHDGIGAADGRDYFHQLWDSINASRGFAWSTNRPVFVLTYKRIRP